MTFWYWPYELKNMEVEIKTMTGANNGGRFCLQKSMEAENIFLPLWMTACISRTFMWHNRWDADHCPCVECEPNWAPQPELDASVKRVTSVSLAARGRPCRTAGDDHHATSDRTHCGTWIRSDQFPVLWHHAVAAHQWTGRRRSRPRRTS